MAVVLICHNSSVIISHSLGDNSKRCEMSFVVAFAPGRLRLSRENRSPDDKLVPEGTKTVLICHNSSVCQSQE